MIRIKRTLLVFTAIVLVLPSFLVTAASNDEAEISYKDEVVYATLSATGEQQEIYVVNNFDIKEEGTVFDYGTYTSLKNLTDLSEMEQNNNVVQFSAPKGKFYYQGNMNEQPLPWDISLSYTLDGEKINPDELLGSEGHVEIQIETSANEQVNSVFHKNYLLQISLTLDPAIYSNIEAPDGTIANAGKNKQITFTVMPEKEGKFSVAANVVDFELKGIDISAVPSSMSIDSPDMDEMTGDIESLTDAIAEINNGVGDLEQGVSELNDGVLGLRNGSAQYKNGISELSGSSSELVHASKSIDEALVTMSNSLSKNAEQMDFSQLTELQEGLTQLAKGLNQTADGLDLLKENYATAYSALDKAITAIPDHEISEEQIKALYNIIETEDTANKKVVDQLIETYSAARTAKGTYSSVKEGFDAVDPTLTEVSGSIRKVGTNLTSMATELSSSLENMNVSESFTQLQEGLATLSANYKQFHSGLIDYTGGVGQLANSYHDLHAGTAELSGGTSELEDGVGELYNGTAKLKDSTSDLPEQMEEEIDRMIADFENNDFEPVSFVSSNNNEKINTVQFVIKTESIEKEEQATTEEQPVEEKGFWDRLFDLFR
ncbi:YhgE/Pip domain-containing protein [Aquibacillus halophilus]|uniref:YhgE/Pip domain-containing protein n=1 Tax=Aquibacillus halophilus TaxID=930132 RepID=A0A6A8DA62_9BACI|nr:YhgE/Pip domain-containing protein [Aquibacillus halophilus]